MYMHAHILTNMGTYIHK